MNARPTRYHRPLHELQMQGISICRICIGCYQAPFSVPQGQQDQHLWHISFSDGCWWKSKVRFSSNQDENHVLGLGNTVLSDLCIKKGESNTWYIHLECSAINSLAASLQCHESRLWRRDRSLNRKSVPVQTALKEGFVDGRWVLQRDTILLLGNQADIVIRLKFQEPSGIFF